MTQLRSVAIVWDQIATAQASAAETGAAEAAAVQSIAAVIDEVAAAIGGIGARVERVPLPPDPDELFRRMRALSSVDVVVNLAESWAGRAQNEPAIASMLDLLRVPYTGAAPRALALCLEKPLTRAVLASNGVPVPVGWALTSVDASLDPIVFSTESSWIVKPAAQDASHGIDAGSVVSTKHALRARLQYLFERGLGPALIERYIDGREFNVSILERHGSPCALPLAEIDFTGFPEGIPRILTFSAKWDEASEEYQRSKSTLAHGLEPQLRSEIEAIALAAWHALGLRDYARIDVRLDRDGRPFVIDVNPNPDLSRGAGLSLAAERAGISHEQLIEIIVQSAARRGSRG